MQAFAFAFFVTPDLVVNFTLCIRQPPCFVIASGAKQSRVRANRSGLLRSARNDGIADAKAISANLIRGDGTGNGPFHIQTASPPAGLSPWPCPLIGPWRRPWSCAPTSTTTTPREPPGRGTGD